MIFFSNSICFFTWLWPVYRARDTDRLCDLYNKDTIILVTYYILSPILLNVGLDIQSLVAGISWKVFVQLSEILFAQVIPVKLIGWIKESDCLSQWFRCFNPHWTIWVYCSQHQSSKGPKSASDGRWKLGTCFRSSSELLHFFHSTSCSVEKPVSTSSDHRPHRPASRMSVSNLIVYTVKANSQQCRNLQGAPIKNNPLEKML